MPLLIVNIALVAVLAIASGADLRDRRIPNLVTFPAVGLGLVLNGVFFGFDGLRESGQGAGLGLAMLFGLFVLRWMGAGDVKLMAAVGALVGWERWFGIFFITALIGGVMALILVVARGRLKKTLFNVSFILSEMKSGRPRRTGR